MTTDERDELCQLIERILVFADQCIAEEHTDPGEAWEVLRHIQRELGRMTAVPAGTDKEEA